MNKANYIRLTNGKTATENYKEFRNKQRETLTQEQVEKECIANENEQLKKLGKTIEKSIAKAFKR